MNLLDLLRGSKYKVNTPNGNKPIPYQDSIIKMRNVKFPPNLSPGSGFDDYIRFIETGAVAGSPSPTPIPPAVIDYLVTENNNLLMTENDNNLIV